MSVGLMKVSISVRIQVGVEKHVAQYQSSGTACMGSMLIPQLKKMNGKYRLLILYVQPYCISHLV